MRKIILSISILAIAFTLIFFLGKEKQSIISCYFGNTNSCHNVGHYNRTGEENTKINLEKAKKYYEKACEKDYGISCHSLGIFAHEKRDLQKARQYYDKGCNLGYADSCHNLGYLEREEQNIEVSMKYFEKGCNLDQNQSCLILGIIYSYNEENYEKGDPYLEKACNLNNGIACNSLGVHYENGIGTKIDLKKAYKFYKKSCENLKDYYGCGSLGYLYLIGNSADDAMNLPEFYEKICKFNDGKHCDDISNFLKNYDFIDRNYTKAKEFLEYSCKGIPQSCGILGVMAEFGKGMPQDKIKAKEQYRKTCYLNYKLGCDELKRLEND